MFFPSILGCSLALLSVAPSMVAADTVTARGNSKIATAWFAGWHATEGFGIDKISWSKYTQLTYSFAVTTPDVNVLSLSDSDAALLPKFVQAAHSHGVKASVSIGGWTGSRWYSTNVGSAANRTAFVKTVTSLATKYKLDGIDFDWEYPNGEGIGCNIVNPADTANFLLFLQELRANPVGKALILSAATSIKPFIGANGQPSTNVSAFSKVLNYIAIMNYDIWGSWSNTVGPNAPLNDTCAPAGAQQGSAVSAVKAWSAAGMPTQQIVLGVASYGHSFSVAPSAAFVKGSKTVLNPYANFNKAVHPNGDRWDDAAGVDACGVMQPVGGNFDFWGLIEGGFLNANGSAAAGIPYLFDSCSKTAFVYKQASQVMVSFDDAKSFATKGEFIKLLNLGGFAMWEAGGDSKDILLNAIRGSVGM